MICNGVVVYKNMDSKRIYLNSEEFFSHNDVYLIPVWHGIPIKEIKIRNIYWNMYNLSNKNMYVYVGIQLPSFSENDEYLIPV